MKLELSSSNRRDMQDRTWRTLEDRTGQGPEDRGGLFKMDSHDTLAACNPGQGEAGQSSPWPGDFDGTGDGENGDGGSRSVGRV